MIGVRVGLTSNLLLYGYPCSLYGNKVSMNSTYMERWSFMLSTLFEYVHWRSESCLVVHDLP